MTRDRVLEILLSRWFSVGMNGVCCVVFGAIAVFVVEPVWVRMIWAFAAGQNFGFALMWWWSPRINARWRREMEAEISLIVAKTIHKANTDMVAAAKTWFRPDDDEPPARRLQ
jgi:hypothetical protein